MALSDADKLALAKALLRDIRRRLTPKPGVPPPEGTRKAIVHDIRQFLKDIEKVRPRNETDL